MRALNGVDAYDWAGFLHARRGWRRKPPLDGLARGGYRLVYTDKQSEAIQKQREPPKRDDFAFSLGLIVDEKDKVTDVDLGRSRLQGRLTVGARSGGNGDAYDADVLKDAITAAKTARRRSSF